MHEDVQLYMNVRKLAENGLNIQDIQDELESRYDKERITKAYQEYEKDERIEADDRLMRKIRQKYSDGYSLLEITNQLENQGYDSYTIGKAMMRVDLEESYNFKDITQFFTIHSVIHTGTLLISTLLTLYISTVYIIPTLILLFVLISDYLNVRKLASKDPDFHIIPGIGLYATQGSFGYISGYGTFIRWHVMKPEIALVSLFTLYFILIFISDAFRQLFAPTIFTFEFIFAYILILTLNIIAYMHRHTTNAYTQ